MAVTYIELHVRLVQLSHFNIAKLFNDHILFQEYNFLNLFVYYTLDSQVSLSSRKFTWSLNKIRIINPKNHGNFKNSKPRFQFYWFL